MQIRHPQTDKNGTPRENIFIVEDDAGQPMGTSAVVEYVNHTLLPSRPLNYYISLDGQARVMDMLFGASITRARMLRRKQPNLPARIYTPCKPDDTVRLHYFMQRGFVNDDAELVMRWRLDREQAAPRPPVGCRILYTPLETSAQCEALLNRASPYFHSARSMQWLGKLQREPLFACFGMLQEDQLLGELLLTGYGSEGRVHMLYTAPPYRRRGIARAMLANARKVMLDNDIRFLSMEVWQRNHPAVFLCQSLGFEQSSQTVLYPGMNL